MRKITKIVSLCSACLLTAASFGLTACGSKDDTSTLEIFIGDFGYGTAWLDAVIEDFKEEAWVKEKYPNLKIPQPQKNSTRSYPADQITSGNTTIDLFFAGGSMNYYYDMVGADGNHYYEELTDLVNRTVEGENVTIGQKMDKHFRDAYNVTVSGKKGYYAIPWAQGPWGIFYNKAAMTEKLGADYALPTTTEGLLKLCEDLKAGDNAKVPFVFCSTEDYQSFLVALWWTQYEGVDNYERYWLGVDENDFLNTEEFTPAKQKGKLRALEAMEALIGKDSGNTHPYVNTLSFTEAQTELLLGNGVMQVNGDWLQNEMSVVASKEQLDKISMMATPVVSAIVEKLSFYHSDKDYSELTASEKAEYDVVLQQIIAEVDSGATSSNIANVTEADFAIVKEARKLVNIIGGHDAVIPSYSKAKDVAKDFLAYMVQDKNLNTYIKVTNGCTMPYEYDLKERDSALYESLSEMHKTKMEIIKDGIVKPSADSYVLKYRGMLQSYTTWTNISFCFTAPNETDYHTAKEIYEKDIEYYSKNNAHNWKQVLERVGY